MQRFAVLWTQVHPVVAAFIAGIVPRHHDAEDILQRTAAALVVHRVAQEGLTNARKHAPEAAVSIVVATTGDDVSVLIRNERPTTAPMDLPGSGAGLVGLAERVRLVGGTIHSGPTADGGWELRAGIPIPAAEETL